MFPWSGFCLEDVKRSCTLTVTDLYTVRSLTLKSKGRNSRGAVFSGPYPACGGRDRFWGWPENNGLTPTSADSAASTATSSSGSGMEGMPFRQAAQNTGKTWEGLLVKSASQKAQKYEKALARLDFRQCRNRRVMSPRSARNPRTLLYEKRTSH